MTVDERHAAKDRLGEVHYHINGPAIGDVHGVDLHWIA